ncbi:MAG: hypothetical protein AB8I08_06490 [Sandaracinaceae bacterium]
MAQTAPPPPRTHEAPSATTPDAPPVEPDGVHADRLRVGLLGVNAWLVMLLTPVLADGWGSLGSRLGAASPWLALVLGLAWLGRHPERARWALLAGFVPLLGLGLVLRPDALVPGPYAALSLSLCAISLLAYVAAAAHACSRPRVSHPAKHFPIAGRAPLNEASPARWVRAALLGSSAAGAFFAVVIVPAWGGPNAAWGDASREGAALTTVVAALAGAGALAAIVGPGLRAERRRRSRRAPLRRVVMAAVGLGLLSALGWAALVYGNRL